MLATYPYAVSMKDSSVKPHILDRLPERRQPDRALHKPAASGENRDPATDGKDAPVRNASGANGDVRGDASPAEPGPDTPARQASTQQTSLQQDLAQQALAHEAIRCTTLYVSDQPDLLVTHSAAFLDALVDLWVAREIDVSDIWREIDHRTQLGNLLTQLNKDMPAPQAKPRKFWRPSSTKLP